MDKNYLNRSDKVLAVYKRLKKLFPAPRCALDYHSPFQLLCAVILSAQCTDERVNQVTSSFFDRYQSPKDFLTLSQTQLEKLIYSTGFYKNKAKNILGAATIIQSKYGGQLPQTQVELVNLPGVGRKTANVVLGELWGIPGITVDTHFSRLTRRLGLTQEADAVKIEFDLMSILPKKYWTEFSHLLILHGRGDCDARRPLCAQCVLEDICPKRGVVSEKVNFKTRP